MFQGIYQMYITYLLPQIQHMVIMADSMYHYWKHLSTLAASARYAQEFKFFFLTQLIAILNSNTYTMSPVARLRYSAFLRGGFTAL